MFVPYWVRTLITLNQPSICSAEGNPWVGSPRMGASKKSEWIWLFCTMSNFPEMSYEYVTMQWVLWVSWCSFRPCEEEGVLINPLEPTGGMWAQIFLHDPDVLGCCRKVAFVFLWCFVYQCKTWQPCLGTVSWVCKNAKPVALKMPEPLGSKYEHTVLLTPDWFQEDFSYPFFWTSFKVPNSPHPVA